jgi:hypothetical protein
MAQAVSRWSFTAEARVRARVNACGICGGQSGTGQVFLRVLRFPLQIYHSTIAPYSSITAPWGVRLLWPSSTLSQLRSSVRDFTSDPAHWLETEKNRKKGNITHVRGLVTLLIEWPSYYNLYYISLHFWNVMGLLDLFCIFRFPYSVIVNL